MQCPGNTDFSLNERLLTQLNRESLVNQVYQADARYILRTGAKVGDNLPSERRFSQLLEVSRTIVRAALTQLEEDGYIERRIGMGVVLSNARHRSS